MPVLNWIGREAVVNYDKQVPFRLIEQVKSESYGNQEAGNLFVHGDNLEALKSLMPHYAGQVKCVFIDPPYNTGNEHWVYNDNVNAPAMKKWLGQVVGSEGDDLTRHDKWLCMMYPRLVLLRDLLADDGSIWITLDNNEVQYLKVIMDEIFGRANFRGQITWQKRYTVSNNAKGIASVCDYILVYAKSEKFKNNLLPRTDESKERYQNPDNDPRGPWKASSYRNQVAPEKRPNLCYPIKNPNTGKVVTNEKIGKAWKFEPETHALHVANNLLWWGVDGGKEVPDLKRFLSEVRDGMLPTNLWMHDEAGNTDDAKKESVALFGAKDAFDTPKPEQLLMQIIEVATQPGDLVLDSFAGSGTTGAVAQKMGRRWIMVEMEDHYQRGLIPRMRKVTDGEPGGVSGSLGWKGGAGFASCKLGAQMFDAEGQLSKEVKFLDLARHIHLIETGRPLTRGTKSDNPLIGEDDGKAIYLLYNGVLGDKKPQDGNVLTRAVLADLPKPKCEKIRIVYGEGCLLSADRLRREGISFKQTPYQVRVN